MRRWNIGRDTAAAALLCSALVFPWNLYFGIAITDSSAPVFAAVALATLLSLSSIGATYAGPRRMFGEHFDPLLVRRLRLGLNVPYLLLVFGFVAFDVVQTVRYGGSARPPGGVGPGAWLGVAGALLAAQPVITDTATDDRRFGRWLLSTRILGYASIVGAGLSVLFNLYWRIRYALPSPNAATGFGRQLVAIITTALVYGVVAWITVFAASRWLLQRGKPAQIATVMLGESTLIAGLLVWGLPIGRDIDGFHGIAQNTSTAGVGFEGYLGWVAAAAIFVAPTLNSFLTAPRSIDDGAWLAATRKILLLIVIWCLGSVLMRITDLAVATSLDLPYSPYDSAAMAAFDLVTAVIAVWLRINLANRSLPLVAIWSMCAVLFGFTLSRIVVGIGLAPRFADSQRAGALANPVYGNNLAQQITSTFDVVLCGLALGSLAAATVVATKSGVVKAISPLPRIFRLEGATQRPKIYRPADDSAQHGRHEA
ncbi:MAG TPA: hypothetical protein VFQ37_18085 [Mycobacterium sp.]|nr:hypothetical protein [Mycobacterium sp.]